MVDPRTGDLSRPILTRPVASAIAAALLSFFLPIHHAVAVSTAYLGEIITFGGTFCPVGFLPLDGRFLQISEYENLFNLIGTTYGGNGESTFALPAMPPTFAVNGHAVLFCIAVNGIYPTPN